jgi:UDP-N-acetylglucosamine 2-epimerase
MLPSPVGSRARVALFMGTRPEAIKLAPVFHRMQASELEPVVVSTGQHREMLRQVVEHFDIEVRHDLQVMRADQSLGALSGRLLEAADALLREQRFDLALVQGDTTTALMASLACFYHRIPVGHVEAGLRTQDALRPYPEEMNRRLATRLAALHFAPTPWSRDNLLREGVPSDSVLVTGNTVIDALRLELARQDEPATAAALESELAGLLGDTRRSCVLITGHRRESFGAGFRAICAAIARLARAHPDLLWVYPVHLNPNVRAAVRERLSRIDNVVLLEPQPYRTFVALMRRAHFVLTDSGGVQEEAPSLGKPVLVLRDSTERPEAVAAGTALLVGADEGRIVAEVSRLLADEALYGRMARAVNPFGDGRAAERIVARLEQELARRGAPATSSATARIHRIGFSGGCANADPGRPRQGVPPAVHKLIQLPSDQDASGRSLGLEEIAALVEALQSGALTSTKGTFVKRLEGEFARRLGVRHAFACSSGSAAVHCAVAAIDPEPGDEIVTTAITDMGALAPILYQGAIPVFADVDPRTYNVTAETIARCLSPRTKAIVVTHLFGNPCEMDAILELALQHGLAVIEDCAQAFLARSQGRLVGTLGTIGCFSLQQGKHITTGEGGLVVTNDDQLARRIFLFINKAWGYGDTQPDHYFLALNYRMSELQGAVALPQLAKLDASVSVRRERAQQLPRLIRDLPGIGVPHVEAGDQHSWWRYCIQVDAAVVQGGAPGLGAALKEQGIACAPRYIQKPAFRCQVFKDQRTFGASRFPFTLARPEAVDYADARFPGTFAALEKVIVLPWNEKYQSEHVQFIAGALRESVERLAAVEQSWRRPA